MPSPLTLVSQSTGRQVFHPTAALVAPSPELHPDAFTLEPEWTHFFSQWCSAPEQAVPQIGTIGTGGDREVVALHAGLLLRSVFQPIFSVPTLQTVAFEALVRAQSCGSGNTLAPEALFSLARTRTQGVLLDRLCRMVHLLNFERQSHPSASLYLNLATLHLQALQPGQHGSFMEAMRALSPLALERIILEITETQFDDRDTLTGIVQTFKHRGYRVAIDDFGARHSNFDRLWALTPDIVKIDRELLLQADGNPRVRKILPKVVDIIHDLDAQVVCEGIETRQQQELAVSAGVDLLQGFGLAKPARQLTPAPAQQ
jgi:EAL domain-containing protein (putative c-di-GMP-specific phosphodiesterase class I)